MNEFTCFSHALFNFLAVTLLPSSLPTLFTVPPTALAPLPTAPTALPSPRFTFAPKLLGLSSFSSPCLDLHLFQSCIVQINVDCLGW